MMRRQPDKRRFFRWGLILLVLSFAASVFGCAGGTEVGNPEVSRFSSDAAVKDYLVDQYAESAQPTALWAMDNDAPAVWTDPGGYAEESRTIIQDAREAGADQSDLVKTDGTYLYVAAADEVRIVSAAPLEAMRVAGRVKVTGAIDSLYLHGHILVILFTPADGAGASWAHNDNLKRIDVGIPSWLPVAARTGIMIVDVGAPDAPRILTHIEADGIPRGSRLTGGRLHLVIQFLPELPPLELWHDGTGEGKSAATSANRNTLAAMAIDDFLPSCTFYDENGSVIREKRLVATEDLVRPDEPAGGTILSVLSIDLDDPSTDFASIGFIADIHHVHTSPESIYLVATLFDESNGTGADTYRTHLYRLDLSGAAAVYAAEGQAPGHILDPFSLGEQSGILRLATTTGAEWDRSASNQVYCLKQEKNALLAVGAVEHLAPGERLLSARFIGDRGFLATSSETDPLLTIDLSDSARPKAIGELRLPGPAAALYPIGDNHLLAVGKEIATDAAWSKGIYMSMFDLGELSHPQLLHTVNIGDLGTDSEILDNSQALAFRPWDGLIAFPVTLREHMTPPANPADEGANTFTGLYVYRLDGSYNLNYLGRMEIPAGIDGADHPAWMRGIFIGDAGYAASAERISAGSIPGIGEAVFTVGLAE